MASLWRAEVSATEVSVRDEQISFPLPFDIGTFEGRIRGDELAGSVAFTDGEIVPVTLARRAHAAIRTQDVAISSGGATIAATLALPEGSGPFPAVVVIHGAGDSDRRKWPIHR
jgi:hypothetical protein